MGIDLEKLLKDSQIIGLSLLVKIKNLIKWFFNLKLRYQIILLLFFMGVSDTFRLWVIKFLVLVASWFL